MPITVRPLAPLAARLERMEGGQGSWQEAVAHFTKELGHSVRVPVSPSLGFCFTHSHTLFPNSLLRENVDFFSLIHDSSWLPLPLWKTFKRNSAEAKVFLDGVGTVPVLPSGTAFSIWQDPPAAAQTHWMLEPAGQGALSTEALQRVFKVEGAFLASCPLSCKEEEARVPEKSMAHFRSLVHGGNILFSQSHSSLLKSTTQ